MEDIVIATNNQGKINDFKAIFKNQHVIGISELIEDFDVEETGATFEAVSYTHLTLPTILLV